MSAPSPAGQAAAEYVGTMLSGAAAAIGRGADSVGRFFQQNPVGVIIGLIVVALLLGMARRRR